MIITLDRTADLPRRPLRQVDGEPAEAVQARYPDATLYRLAKDYTTRVWVDDGGTMQSG